MSLVSKFDSLEIDMKLHLCKDDLNFLEQLDRDFKAFLAHENIVRQKHAEAIELIKASFNGEGNQFFNYCFNFEAAGENQESEYDDACDRYVLNIVEYFNSRYSLSIEKKDAPKC